MATGTNAGLLDSPQPQAVYKHGILEQYVIRYATMTASKLNPKRAVLFDGFAGRGRFDSGEAASAEHMMLAAQKAKPKTQIDIFLVEKNETDYCRLDAVAEEYRARGIKITTRHGECADHLDKALAVAKGATLFVFLDPCGAVLPFNVLSSLLHRRGTWPRTEILLNFNASLIRRAGGQYNKGQLDLGGVAMADRVCGGDWWRETALQAHRESGRENWAAAADAVATEYARRLVQETGYGSVVAPVRRQVHQQPIYFLIFLTVDPAGFWVFGDAAARARERWLRFLGPDEEALEGMLFNSVEDQLEQEHEKAVVRITANVRKLVADGRPKEVVRFTTQIFGDVYGEAKETAYTATVRQLVRDGEVEVLAKGKPHKNVIRGMS